MRRYTALLLKAVISVCPFISRSVRLSIAGMTNYRIGLAYSSLHAGLPSPLRELTYHHTVLPATRQVTLPPLPQPKLVLDLATPEGCKAELT